MAMSVDVAAASSTQPPRHFQRPPQQFDNTAALRQAVMSKEDEYSNYEQAILLEINELRSDPVAYSSIVESEATVGYPFVRDDPLPDQCSEMTLEQLRVYIQDFRRERSEVKESLRRIRGEWVEAEAGMRERWTQEDTERAKKKRGSSRKLRNSLLREEDFMVERQRIAQELNDRYTQRTKEAESKLLHLERSCRWAVDGANVIIKLVQQMREAHPVPTLQYSRGLTLAARDVGNECHRVPTTSAISASPPPPPPPTVTTSASPPPMAMAACQQPRQSVLLSSSSSPPPPMSPPRMPNASEDALLHLSRPLSGGSNGGGHRPSQPTLSCEEDITNTNTISIATTDVTLHKKDISGRTTPLMDVFSLSTAASPTVMVTAHELTNEGEQLKRTTMKMCKRYGYYSGAVRGLQLCNAFPPRKTLIQMMLGLRVPHFTLLALNAVSDAPEASLCSSASRQSKSPLLWADGRLLGSGWVRAPDGVVSVTALVATSFEELRVIHDRHDFSLPQIHRILNSRHEGLAREPNRPAVMHILSALEVCVIEPQAHPVFADRDQHVVRLVARADSHRVELTATVTLASEPVPVVPLLDRELLLVQRCRDDLEEVEVLLDIRAARHRWGNQPLFVYLFERDKSATVMGAFANIGFIRVTPMQRDSNGASHTKRLLSLMPPHHHHNQQQQQQQQQGWGEAAVIRTPLVLASQWCEYPVEIKEEPFGWPLVSIDFQERCATIIEPLCGTLIALGDLQRIAIQIPHCAYLEVTIDNVRRLLEVENTYLESEDPSGSQQRLNKLIASSRVELRVAEESFNESADPIKQELAHVQKSMARRRGKELTKLKKQEDELQQRLNQLNDNVEELRKTLANAKEDLVLLGREYALRAKQRRQLRREYDRLCERADRTRPLRVEIILVTDDAASVGAGAERTPLRPVNAANTLYEGTVRLLEGLRCRAVLLINDQEAVCWEVRPGY
ncbi:hypothetical protein DQ04_06011000 [Trypanosoma grayi]|uniref:hypothetical protein n=1 Tax=Trypanosoma grayi TaxID=71804 RepID=UPI0004F40A4A|nr:hypothetical protein DQ04_06011000 [Trypanosoma grayi]KEG09004.1 hypothetical protein DQ04_06011000 [Trypanosoma grayi]